MKVKGLCLDPEIIGKIFAAAYLAQGLLLTLVTNSSTEQHVGWNHRMIAHQTANLDLVVDAVLLIAVVMTLDAFQK